MIQTERTVMIKSRLIPGLMIVMLVLFVGCENDTSNGPIEEAGDHTCLDCHSSEEMLVASIGDESGSKVVVGLKDDG